MPVLGAPVVNAPSVTGDERTFVEYVAADGTIVPLTDMANGWIVMPGPIGLGDLPYSLIVDNPPARDGGILRGVRANVRDLVWPMFVIGTDRADILRRVRSLAADMDPRDGPGELRVLQPDGTGRRISALYVSGMEGDEGQAVAGLHWQKFAITFRALDPAWLDMTDQQRVWTIGSANNFFPILPLHLALADVLGAVTITNPGDEQSYPVWTVTGPGTGFTLTNQTTGRSVRFKTALSSGESITLDTRPSKLTVVDQAGANRWPDLAPNPDLWALRRGVNFVDLDLSGASSASSVTLTFTPRYKTA